MQRGYPTLAPDEMSRVSYTGWVERADCQTSKCREEIVNPPKKSISVHESVSKIKGGGEEQTVDRD